MISLKRNSHKDRQLVATELAESLKKQHGKNLLALIAEGSFARNEDMAYSDLEFTALLRKLPKNKDLTIRKIVNGLLIVVIFETEKSYIDKYLEVNDTWYASGLAAFYPIVDHPVIQKLSLYRPKNLEKKCLAQIRKRWAFYQEITAKVLNSIEANNKELFALAYPQMLKEVLIIMSYLNTTPYTTLGSYISQANGFNTKPQGFEKLVEYLTTPNYKNIKAVKNIVMEVFTDLERILLSEGLTLFSDRIA